MGDTDWTKNARMARDKLTEQLGEQPEIVGSSIGLDGPDLELVIVIYTDGNPEGIPEQFEGFRVVSRATGAAIAL